MSELDRGHMEEENKIEPGQPVTASVPDTSEEKPSEEAQANPGADDVVSNLQEVLEAMSRRADELLAWETKLEKSQEELQKRRDNLGQKMAEAGVLEEQASQLRFRERSLEEKEKQFEDNHGAAEKEYEQREAHIRELQQQNETERREAHKDIEARQAEVLKRENAIKEQENKLDEKLAAREEEHRKALLAEEKEKIQSLTAWAESKHQEYHAQLLKTLSDHEKELSDLRDGLYEESKQNLARERQARLQDVEKELNEKRAEMQALDAKREQDAKKMQDEKDEIAAKKQKYDIKLKQLVSREGAIDDAVREGIEREAASIKERLEIFENRNEQLLNDLRQKSIALNEMKQAMADFGDQPFAAMKKQLDEAETENKKLKDALADAPARFDAAEYDALKAENEALLEKIKATVEENRRMQEGQSHVVQLEFENQRMNQQLEYINGEFNELKEINNGLSEQIKRLSGEQQAEERDKRIKSIETWKTVQEADEAGADRLKSPASGEVPEQIDELHWLDRISKYCFEYGFKFPRRILYAFHTALKIADWSMITVLAGVSGTGKSELPHLYSRFGGLNFISVPVQPNWDSQESMLGFFNSIDNKFDAQPMLRFLAQCSSADQGMERSLNLVLLDEMNLAHVEHYFAEFLSKLELRRDYDDAHIPCIDINIGAGMRPYQLRLTRNILWTGTMNQDETTKSLSDKVIDRGIVIHFPRPKRLYGRQNKESIDEFLQKNHYHVQMLDYRIWRDQWMHQPVFEGEQKEVLKEYRTEVIEKINDYLAEAGRALGHRVWQSIEYYIANYPLVIEAQRDCQPGECTKDLRDAMHQALEDQLVQKVMPKLRGIETSGPMRTKCLDKIQALLENQGFDDLKEDFQRACDIGYGQFIWSSADYINDSDIAGVTAEEEVSDKEDTEDEA